MAKFNTTGVEGLQLSLEEVADLPEDTLRAMLMAGGEVVRAAHVKKIRELGLVDTRQLEKSITIYNKMRVNRGVGGMERYVLVYPQGTRSKGGGAAQTTRHVYKKKRAGKTESVHATTNGEVGFVNEYGAPRRGIAPKQWMRLANAEAEGPASEAERRVYNAWLEKKGL